MKKKKIGIGSISLLLFIAGFLFTFTIKDICIGDNILNYIGLKSWSKGEQGLHYTILYSLLFFVPSVIIGYKFKDDFGSKTGKTLSTIMIIMIIIFSLLFIAFL